MELKEARYIAAIAKHGNISRAAQELYISQPSLSKYLKNLEHQLGVELFDRIDGQYQPTYIGERYVDYARRILLLAREWQDEFQDLRQQEIGQLNIALPIMLSRVLMKEMLPAFSRLYPKVHLQLMEELHFIVEHTLEDLSIDLSIYNAIELPKSLHYEIIKEEETVLLMRREHPLCARAVQDAGRSFPWMDLRYCVSEPFILLFPDQNSGGLAEQLFEQYKLTPRVLLRTRSIQLAIEMAMDGTGICFAPAGYAAALDSRHSLRCFSVGTQAPATQLIAACRKNRYMPQYMRDFIGLIREYCTGQPHAGGDAQLLL